MAGNLAAITRGAIAGLLLAAQVASAEQPVTALDLVSLREIGGYSGNLTVSPNGRAVAFQLQQADLAARTYKVDWFVMPLDGKGKAVNVGGGGDLMLNPNPFGRTNGSRAEIKAEWSPDGQWIAYLRKDRGAVQVWRSRADGSMQEQVTHNAADAMTFKWAADGNAIHFSVGRDREWMRATDQQEADQGYLLDDRFSPFESLAPKWSACGEGATWGIPPPASQLCKPAAWIVKPGEQERKASAEEEQASNALNGPQRQPGIDPKRQIQNVTWDSGGTRAAWFENEDPATFGGASVPSTLFADDIRCGVPECRGQLRSVWWNGGDVVLFRLEGHSFSIPAVYAWKPGAKTARLIHRFDGTLTSCEPAGGELICLHETPTTPRRIVAIDLGKGAHRTVWDPNPEFRRFAVGTVERIEWHDRFGNETFGHLVYPPGYVAGRRYPLVIVQYRSRGFLKGGVGDEFPIFPLAASGFLVLSLDTPEDRKVMALCRFDTLENMKACVARQYQDGYRLRSKLSGLEIILDRLAQRGLVDREKIGITGLSDGAETADYALCTSKLFAAAAVTGTWWSHFYPLMINDAERGLVRDLQKPSIADDGAVVSAPLLIQVSDAEFIATVPSFTALKDAHKPVEAYVFPNEYHIKWQPQHKLAVGRRTIDWFRFWLKGEQDADPLKAGQYARWIKMRSESVRAPAQAPNFTTTESGLRYAITQHGSGPAPRAGQVVIAHYVGTLADGKEFDSSIARKQPIAFTLGKGQVIKGWDEGFGLLSVGDKATLVLPAAIAYGDKGVPNLIPPDSTLTFQVEFLDLKDRALADALGEAIDSAGVAEAKRRFEELKAAGFAGYYVSESQVNGLGYRYLKKEKNAEATAAFLWNVDLFPKSANALDSLAEGYAKSGNSDLAKDSCRRALAINPDIGKMEGSWCAAR